MDKRYQVFISSTFADLRVERQEVIKTVIALNCIPAGMELFPASDEEQFDFIKRVIDYCDYYVLIIGHRYGSPTPEGISYTEKEYDYALSKGLEVLAFPRELDGDCQPSREDEENLRAFRQRVEKHRLVRPWRTTSELEVSVSRSLSQAMHNVPATGWIRADRAPQEDVLAEINEIRKQNDALKEKVAALESELGPALPDLAGLDEEFAVRLRWMQQDEESRPENATITASWHEIFTRIAPGIEDTLDSDAKVLLGSALVRKERPTVIDPYHVSVHPDDFDTVRIQLEALGLVRIERLPIVGGTVPVWKLTGQGRRLMVESRAIRSGTS
jgi:hypothetical protein